MNRSIINGRGLYTERNRVGFRSGESASPGGSFALNRQQLSHRYPGVEFRGADTATAHIESTVQMRPGAVVVLSSNLRITGSSVVDAGAMVSGGSIDDCHIGHGGKITGGVIGHSQICGTVSGGSVKNSSVFGTVSGGSVDDSSVSGTVSGGSVNGSLIDGIVSNGVVNYACVASGQTVHSGSSYQQSTSGRTPRRPSGGDGARFLPDLDNPPAPTSLTAESDFSNFPNFFPQFFVSGNAQISIGDTYALNDSQLFPSFQPIRSGQQRAAAVRPAHPSVPAAQPGEPRRLRLPPPRTIPAGEIEKFDAEPPDELTDEGITKALMSEAVITPNGDTYERTAIEKWIAIAHTCPVTRDPIRVEDLTPNRLIQRQIDRWKAVHRIVDSELDISGDAAHKRIKTR